MEEIDLLREAADDDANEVDLDVTRIMQVSESFNHGFQLRQHLNVDHHIGNACFGLITEVGQSQLS